MVKCAWCGRECKPEELSKTANSEELICEECIVARATETDNINPTTIF